MKIRKVRRLRRRILHGGCEYLLARADKMKARADFYKREGFFREDNRMLALGDVYVHRMCWYIGRVRI